MLTYYLNMPMDGVSSPTKAPGVNKVTFPSDKGALATLVEEPGGHRADPLLALGLVGQRGGHDDAQRQHVLAGQVLAGIPEAGAAGNQQDNCGLGFRPELPVSSKAPKTRSAPNAAS